MTQSIKQAIAELEAQAKRHENAATAVRQAIAQLRALLGADAGAAPSAAKTPGKRRRRRKGAAVKAAAPKANAPTKTKATRARKGKRLGKPTLAATLEKVLRQRGGGATSGELYSDVQKAGFRFGGNNVDNNRHYVYKTLRTNRLFKRQTNGTYALA